MKNWIVFLLISIAVIILFLTPFIVLIANEFFDFIDSLLKYFAISDFINLCKIVFSISILMALGYFVCDYLVSGNLLNDLNNFSGLRYFSNLVIIIIAFPAVVSIILFYIVAILNSGYNGLMDKIGRNPFPEPGDILAAVFYVFLSLFFSTLLILSFIADRKITN